MAIKIIINPCSGRGRGRSSLKTIEQQFAEAGLDFDIELTSAAGEAIELAKEAVEADYSLVVAGGGDGTLNEVVTGILAAESPYPRLALIPVGTGNNLARALDIPLEAEGACQRIIKAEKVIKLDVAKVNDRYFLNSLGIGLNSQTVYNANQGFDNMTGSIVYMLAAVQALSDYESVELEIRLDSGELIEGAFLMMVIGNGKVYSRALDLIPDYSINDGLLDLCLIEEMSTPELIAKFPKFLATQHEDLAEVTMRKIKAAQIRVLNSDRFQVDGEVLTGEELEISILPQVLEMII
ncbi:diacylglycerol/lipid kinase family protein [Fuchsiella alkaliacetigena]|uniref:diacylglycerol/lipid kinase family protein n=1 Tax=Fuchsiella alkaliacetigena TaxID=957042 RepID=UPI00200AD19A|nr:diacylglycerol kinase family protein [Fuchsiella alkaliacetigena]MCK8823732.1 diacylglycerol kinase family lipid kinase [Fuchsiella alkaliacetigena]